MTYDNLFTFVCAVAALMIVINWIWVVHLRKRAERAEAALAKVEQEIIKTEVLKQHLTLAAMMKANQHRFNVEDFRGQHALGPEYTWSDCDWTLFKIAYPDDAS